MPAEQWIRGTKASADDVGSLPAPTIAFSKHRACITCFRKIVLQREPLPIRVCLQFVDFPPVFKAYLRMIADPCKAGWINNEEINGCGTAGTNFQMLEF